MELIGNLGGYGWTALTFIVALSIIVAVHEYGHYIVARWSGIHAEVFSIGFGPRLFSRVDRRGTRWQVAAIPLGGFVRFLGDANEASAGADAAVMAEMSAQERRRTMQGAPLWARAATAFAGPAFNFIMAILLFAGLILASGIPDGAPVVQSVRATPWTGETIAPGDRILRLAGQDVPDLESFGKVVEGLPATAPVEWVVLRNGEEVSFAGPHPFPALVGSVMVRNAGMDAGILEGDVIVALDGKPVTSFAELPALVQAGNGKPVRLDLWRQGQQISVTLTPNRRDLPRAEGGFETRWLIGLTGAMIFEPEPRAAGIVEALWLGVQNTWAAITGSMSGLYHILLGKISTCNLSGAISMAENVSAAASEGTMSFLTILAVLSAGIGLVNLFPIPVLDGGHLVLYAYEAVFRRKPGEKALRIVFTTGLFIVLSIMTFALLNDVTCT